MLVYALVVFVFISVSTTIATLMMSGRITEYEDARYGLVPVETSDAGLDAEPAVS